MGAFNSCFIGRCITIKEAQENHLKLRGSHVNKKKQRYLSSTFLQFDDNNEQQVTCKNTVDSLSHHICAHVDRVNINSAQEEELMTLPGINRARAKAIVTYRAQLGGFRQPEDLVLVPGMGGDHLTSILPEITVDCGAAAATADSSSLVVSTAGAPILSRCSSFCTTFSLQSTVHPVELNSANIFQLMKVPGLNQKRAEAIVTYREQHIKFHSLTDLIRVKGIDQALVQSLRSHLVVNVPPPRVKSLAAVDSISRDDHNCSTLERLGRLFSSSQLQLIFDLSDSILRNSGEKGHGINNKQGFLNVVSSSAATATLPPLSNECLRVVCWNLEGLGKAKASNPGVREVFCRTLLHNKINLVVLQEVIDCDAVHTLVAELNKPQVPSTKRRAASLRGHWCCEVSTEPKYGGAFLWNSKMTAADDSDVCLQLVSTLSLQSQAVFVGQPYSAHFKVFHASKRTSWDLFVVLLTFVTSGEGLKAASAVVDVVNCTLSMSRCPDREQIPLLLIGNFNLPPNDLISLNHLQSNGLKPLLSKALSTANIWANKAAHDLLQDEMNGVICEGLSHSFIPTSDFGWGARISQSCPLWCELRGPSLLKKNENGCSSKDAAIRLNG